jgi:hypothetical protein
MADLLKDVKDLVVNAIKDVTNLEVASFTGTPAPLGQLDATNVFETVRASMKDATLVGYSRFEIDGDAMNYTNNNLGAKEKELVAAHKQLVTEAKDSQKDFFNFALNIVGGKPIE